jgi:hypothetical protein
MSTGGGVLEQALWFARFGVPVVPCFTPCRCTIRAAVHCDCHRAHGKLGPDCADPEHSIGKHPRTQHGLSDATTDTEQIEKWWGLWPKANLAIRTGADAGLWGLDVDPRHGGDESLLALEFEHGPLPETATVRTGSGGRHILFLHPGGTIPNSSAKVGPGLDVRGDGGYLIAPVSEHVGGNRYEWLAPLATTPLAPAPDWLLALMGAQQGTGRSTWGNSAPAGHSTADDPIPSGRRHQTLASFAGAMRRKGFSAPAILAALRAENDARCVPPLDDGEVERIAADIAKKPPAAAEPVLIRVVQKEERPPSAAAPFPPVPDAVWRGWFGLYRDAMAPTTEAPDAYHLGAALVSAGLVLGRSCYTVQGRRVYPNVYALLMGPSGIKKDTAMERGELVLAPPSLRTPEYIRLPNISSAEGLIEQMKGGQPVLVTISEMSTLLKQAKREGTSNIIPWLTSLYDCPPEARLPTRKDPITAKAPYLCVLAASTPDWFDADVTDDLIRGGFLGRFLFFTGDPKPALPRPPEPNPLALLALRTRLYEVADGLRKMGRQGGDESGVAIPLSDDAGRWFDAWYPRHARPGDTDDLATLFRRVPMFVQKIAMLYAVLDGQVEITAADLELALEVVKLSQAYVRGRYARWGASEDARLGTRMLEYIHANDCKITRRQIRMRFGGRVKTGVFEAVIRNLIVYELLAQDGEHGFRCVHEQGATGDA